MSAPEKSPLPVRTLLIVEDQKELRETIADQVKDLGYDTQQAGDGEEALTLIEAGGAHAVLCDIMMPNMTGIELLHTVRGRGLNIPFLFLTGYSSTDHMGQALHLGAYDFLEKPFVLSDLQTGIERILDIGFRNDADAQTLAKLKARNPDLIKEIGALERNRMHIERLRSLQSKG